MTRKAAEAAVEEEAERASFSLDPIHPPTVSKAEVQAAATLLKARPRVGWLERRRGAEPGSRGSAERESSLRRLGATLRAALSLEQDRGTLFLFIPVLLAAGAISYFSAEGEPAFYALWSGAAALTVLALLANGRPLLQMAFAIALIILLGVLAAKLEVWRTGTKIIGSDITTRISGHVVLVEPQASGRIRLTIDVSNTQRPTLRYAPDRIRVTARRIPPGVEAGSAITGVVRLLPPTGPVRPGSYDFSFQSYFAGIGASGFFLVGPDLDRVDEKTGIARGAGFMAFVENNRTRLAGRISEGIGGVEGEIAAALVVGVRSGIPEPVNEAMRRTGLAHILSISGLHMALVAATVMGALRALFALFPGFASRHPVKKYAAGAALVAISIYLFISGAAVAAERSFIMLAVMLTALLFDRAALTMRNLALAALVVIVRSPHEVMGPSFQMSFAATAALIGGYAAWSGRARSARVPVDNAHFPLVYRVLRKGLFYAGGLALTSLIAGTATTLFGVYHFQRVSPLSLAANLTAMPVVSAIVMPFGVLGMIAMPFGLDGPVFAVMGKGLSVMLAVAEWFSARSPVDAVGLIPAGAVAVMTVALVIATLSSTRLRLMALPFLIIGLMMAGARKLPDVLVSEDARLVGVRLGGDELAVNRGRPSAFTLQNWQRALDTSAVSGPQNESYFDLGREPPGEIPFLCDAGVCYARHGSGAIIAHAANAAAAQSACTTATVIIIDDATAKHVCAGQAVEIITKRDLAAHGSAAIYLSSTGPPEIAFAIGNYYRPWHTQRRFSREARGMPPYQRSKRKSPGDSTDPASTTAEPDGD